MTISSYVLKRFTTNIFLFFLIKSTQIIASTDLATDADAVSEPTESSCSSDDSSYEHSLKLSEDVKFYWTSDNTVLKGSLRYDGVGWLGFGISDGSIVGSDAIIGKPDLEFEDKKSVMKYDIDSDKLSGIVPMEDTMQTLKDASITQDGSKTVLEFTKILKEDTELEIKAEGDNSFVWAVGDTNTVGQEKWNTFALDLSNCDDVTKLGAEMEAAAAITMSADEANSKKGAFVAHGILATFAWSVCASFAVATAWFRRLAPTWWIYMHVLANVTCFMLTLFAFIVVLVAVENNPNTSHLSRSHHYIGLILMTFVTAQVMNGFMRPPVEKVAVGVYQGSQGDKQWSPRDSWHLVHKYSGLTLLLLSVYQISTGLQLFSELFGTKSLVTVYWSTLFIFLISVLVIKLTMVCDMQKPSNEAGKQTFTTLDEVDFSTNVHDDISSLEASHAHVIH